MKKLNKVRSIPTNSIEAFADCVCRCGGCSLKNSSDITSSSRGNPKGPEYNGIGDGEGEKM